MLKKLVITTCVEAVVLTAAAVIKPQFWNENAAWIIILAVAVLLGVALYDWMKARGIVESKSAANSNSTHGPQSPIFTGPVDGGVHIHPPASPHQPPSALKEKGHEKKASLFDDQALAGLKRVMEGGSNSADPKQELAEARRTERLAKQAARAAQRPDIALREVGQRILRLREPSPDGGGARRELIRQINLEIADRIGLDNLSVWARFADFPIKRMEAHELSHVIVDILQDRIRIPNEWRTNDYSDVQFMLAEIDQIWPPGVEGNADEQA